ncbi:MAG: VC0807 family protein [Sporichthyaceae bacterium]
MSSTVLAPPIALAPRAADAQRARPDRPALSSIVRHIGTNLLVSTVVPSALFMTCMLLGNIWWALAAALGWCYGALVVRLCTRRRTSGLLWLTIVSLTAKSAFAFASGSTFLYFLQPVLAETAAALVFLGSLVFGRPLVARLAADFYPMDDELAARPRIRSLFRRLTLLWGLILAAKATTTLYMLQTMSVGEYVATKSVLSPSVAVVGATATILLAARVARREGLLPHRGRCSCRCLPEGARFCPSPA